MSFENLPPRPASTANPAPPRPAGSIRRTCSIDVCWPDGIAGLRHFHGRVRDYLTPANGGVGRTLDEASLLAVIDNDRQIRSITADPAPARLQELVGQRGGGHLRGVIRERMPELVEQAMPLYLSLDDLSGTSLISNWAFSLHDEDWLTSLGDDAGATRQEMMASRVNVCWGFKPGHSSLDPDARAGEIGQAVGGELVNPVDPEGWHALPALPGVSFRRARRIDVTRDEAAGLLRIDSAFQDSAPRPEGGRAALHEYRLAATVDLATGTLASIAPDPRVLPFPECPGVIPNSQRLVGKPLVEIRSLVLEHLRGPEGCTHLNDALRALADVPKLAEKLLPA